MSISDIRNYIFIRTN